MSTGDLDPYLPKRPSSGVLSLARSGHHGHRREVGMLGQSQQKSGEIGVALDIHSIYLSTIRFFLVEDSGVMNGDA